MIAVSGSALLGLAFYESIRVYKGTQKGQKLVPEFGFAKRTNTFIYLVILAVFSCSTIFLSNTIFAGSNSEAFLLGFSVPSGTNLVLQDTNTGISSDNVDDQASEKYGKQAPLKNRVLFILRRYFI